MQLLTFKLFECMSALFYRGDIQFNWTRRSASDGEAGSSDDIKYKQVTKTSNLKKNTNTLEEVEDEEERDEPELDQEGECQMNSALLKHAWVILNWMV